MEEMTHAQAKRDLISEQLADFILTNGLPGAKLRPLAVAAGTSDRMLLYYFKDKEEIISSALTCLMRRLAERLSLSNESVAKPPIALEAELLLLTTRGDLWPYMCVWLETAALAARGDVLFRSIGGQIALGFKTWIAGLLAVDDEAEREEVALRLLRSVEGALVLHAVGVDQASGVEADLQATKSSKAHKAKSTP